MRKRSDGIREIIKEYKKALKALRINVDAVVLYGSYAKKGQREDSDIDLIVISKDFEKMNLRERLEILGIAAVRIMKPVEARGYTPSEIKQASPASFLKEILRVGVAV